jgi:hypothetical protein
LVQYARQMARTWTDQGGFAEALVGFMLEKGLL